MDLACIGEMSSALTVALVNEHATHEANKRLAKQLNELEQKRLTWPNNCDRTIIAALTYLANNPRPTGGQEEFNAEHLLQLANELKSVI